MDITGRTIVQVRWATVPEMEREYWSGHCLVLVLDNGLVVLPSRDEEGNGPGALFAQDAANCYRVFPIDDEGPVFAP